MSQVAALVRDDIITAINNDQLTLPTLPEVALRVREAAENPDIDVAQLTKVLVTDAGISARIIKVANSPLLRGSREIDDLKSAVSRLGVGYTCNLATGLAMEQMFQATSDHIDRRLREVWAHSTEVASISHVLAKHYTKLRPDRAMLSGLLHLMGVLPILTYAEDHTSLLRDSITLNHVIDTMHPEIGTRILRAWEFPEEIACIPMEHVNFYRITDKVDYADIVMVANLQTHAGTGHPYCEMDWTQISAFARVGLDPQVLCADDEDISNDMEAAMATLK